MKEFIKTIKYIIYKYAELKDFYYDDILIELADGIIYVKYMEDDDSGGHTYSGYTYSGVDVLTITQEIFKNPKQELLKIINFEKQQELKKKKEREEKARKRKIVLEKAKKQRVIKSKIKKEKDELELYKKLKLKYEKEMS